MRGRADHRPYRPDSHPTRWQKGTAKSCVGALKISSSTVRHRCANSLSRIPEQYDTLRQSERTTAMNFSDVDRQYVELKRQYDEGALTADAFDEQLRGMMIQDAQGHWWAKARETGDWNYYDQVKGEWVRADPPASQAPSAPPPSPAAVAGAAPATGQQPMTQQPIGQQPVYAAAGAYGSQPELSSGLKIVFYIISFLFWIVGIILYFVYRNKPSAEDRAAARTFLILGVVSVLLSCFCSFSFFGLGMLGSGGF